MDSALYSGRVRHRRKAPRPHAFEYRISLVWLDLSELDEVFRGRWCWSTKRPALAWFKRSDYLGDPDVPLDCAVRDRVMHETGVRPAGPVRLLTHLRTFGHCFNPVSFYYCYDPAGERVETIVAEITNTPWNERHAYVLPVAEGADTEKFLHFNFEKRFHVSPFMPMELDYDWRFTPPDKRLTVRMTNWRDGEAIFDVTLTLVRREITSASLMRTLFEFPLATLQVVWAIYWQALRLWCKRLAFYPHPNFMRADCTPDDETTKKQN